MFAVPVYFRAAAVDPLAVGFPVHQLLELLVLLVLLVLLPSAPETKPGRYKRSGDAGKPEPDTNFRGLQDGLTHAPLVSRYLGRE